MRAHPVLAERGGWDLINDSAAARTLWPNCGLAGGASVIACWTGDSDDRRSQRARGSLDLDDIAR